MATVDSSEIPRSPRESPMFWKAAGRHAAVVKMSAAALAASRSIYLGTHSDAMPNGLFVVLR